jgi:transposase
MSTTIGIDISKTTLDVCILKSKEEKEFYQFDNTKEGHQNLLTQLAKVDVERIICEPTGGYEAEICTVLHSHQYAIHTVNTLTFHHFAKSLSLAKTDRMDAFKLAYYGMKMDVKTNYQQSESQQRLKDLVARREYLVNQLSNEKKNLRHKERSQIKTSIESHIIYLEAAIKELDHQIDDFASRDQDQAAKVELACSVPGIGKILSHKLIAFLPELGNASFDLNELAAIVGLAPYCQDSGGKSGKRFIRGGRKIPRDALYMAALSGSHKIPLLKDLKERLLKKGKPKKVALIACMRKLLAILHSVFKRQQPFLEQLS